jgi:hypothetical protein
VAVALALPPPAVAVAVAGPLSLDPPHGGSYGESYTFIADLEDGGYVQATLGLTNVGPGGVKGLCRVVVVAPGQAVISTGVRVGSGAWHADGTRLAIGPCQARVEGSETVVEAALPDLAIRLAFAAAAAPGAAPGAEATVGADRYQTEVLLYRVPAGLHLVPTQGPARSGTGAGYVDHTRTTVPPRALATRWVRFRSLRAERPMLLLLREGLDGALGPAQVCSGVGDCRAITGASVQRGAPSPGGLFFAIRLDAGEPTHPLTIRSGPLLHRDAPVEELGLLRHVAALFFGSPVTYLFRATADDGNGGGVEGLLEVELRDE